MLEPALAQRPGRVDQAVELNLPDLDARRRLFELYRGSLAIDAGRTELEDLLARTEGVTASFLKEWVRRAAVVAAERTYALDSMSPPEPRPAGVLSVDGEDLRIALEDLLSTRNTMTRAVLGGPTRTRSQGRPGVRPLTRGCRGGGVPRRARGTGTGSPR